MKVLVYFEAKNGAVCGNSIELITAGQKLGEVTAITIGSDLNPADAASYGAPVIHVNQPVSCQDELAAILESEIADGNYDAVLFPATLDGKDLAPRMAARFDSCAVSDVTEIRDNLMIRPAFGGTILEQMTFAAGKKIFATVKSGSYSKPELCAPCDITEKTVPVDETKILAKFIEKTIDITEKVDLEGAQIVVAGGRGCKDEATFGLVKELAGLLGAEVGAFRPVIESGWVSRAHQVGQSGKTIAPKLYIACGISGAMQHISGVTNSDYIVAINKDEDAPIFDIADVSIVGRCEKILPLMIEAIKNR